RQRQQARNPKAPPPAGSSGWTTRAILGFVVILVAPFWPGRASSRDRPRDNATHHQTQTLDRGDAKSVNASVQAGAGQVSIAGGSSRLLDADFDYGYSFSAPKVEYKTESGVGQLVISQDGDGPHFGTTHNDWSL